MRQDHSLSPLDAFWNLDGKAALQMLSYTESGLSAATAADRLKSYGSNRLKGGFLGFWQERPVKC
jgi:hypothetical protein